MSAVAKLVSLMTIRTKLLADDFYASVDELPEVVKSAISGPAAVEEATWAAIRLIADRRLKASADAFWSPAT